MLVNAIPDFTTTTEEIITVHPTRISKTTAPVTSTTPVQITSTEPAPVTSTEPAPITSTEPAPVTTSLPSSSKYSYIPINYGCIKFQKAGDAFFNLADNNLNNCVAQCLLKDLNFRFFITSFFKE